MAPPVGTPFGVNPVDTDPRYSYPAGRDIDPALPVPEIRNFEYQQNQDRFASMQEDAIKQAALEEHVDATWDTDSPYGSVARPKEETLRGYKFLLKQGDGIRDLQFAQHNYGIFDAIIVRKCGVDEAQRSTHPAFAAEHPRYKDFAPLRRNLALLRDYLLVHNLPMYATDGKDTTTNAEKLQGMANQLGDALIGLKPPLLVRWWRTAKRLLSGKRLDEPNVNDFMKHANIPDEGVAFMYEYLYGLQTNPSFRNATPFMQHPSEWRMQPREETPFSDANVVNYSYAASMNRITHGFDTMVGHLHSLEKLSNRDRQLSVEYAREILRNMRINLGNGHDEALVDITDPRRDEARTLLKALLSYRGAISEIADANPNLLQDPSLHYRETVEVLEKIDYRLKTTLHAMLTEEGDTANAQAVARRMEQTPSQYKTNEPIEQLIGQFEAGLSYAGDMLSRLPARVKTERDVSQTRTQQQQAADVVRQGASNISNVRISQVSDPSVMRSAEEINGQQPEPQRDNPDLPPPGLRK